MRVLGGSMAFSVYKIIFSANNENIHLSKLNVLLPSPPLLL